MQVEGKGKGSRDRLYAALLLSCVLALLGTASYLRFEPSNQQRRSQVRDLDAVSRVVYYRVQASAGPRFRLSGGEQSIRLITHLAVDRSAAWPVEQYRPQLRYPYALRFELLDPKGQRRWIKTVHISSAISKGEPQNGVWTHEAAFSETRTFVPTDARVTQIELEHDIEVNSSLQVRLISPESSFAMVRAYGLRPTHSHLDWMDTIAMSPAEKRELVQGITYLNWDEVDRAQQKERLSKKISRLTAASNVQSESKIVPLYLSDYRVLRSPQPLQDERAFLGLWNESYIVQGPTRLKLTLKFQNEQLVHAESRPHLLHIQRSDEQGNHVRDLAAFFPWKHAQTHQAEHFIDVPTGQHTLSLRWDPPEPGHGHSALLRSRRNQIRVSHARTQDKRLPYSLEDTQQAQLKLSVDRWNPSSLHDDHLLHPTQWRSSYYYVSQETGPLHFLIPTSQESARNFRIKASDWDHAPHQVAQKSLAFAFLDDKKNRINGGLVSISQSFDRNRYVTVQGTLKGSDAPSPLNIGLGSEEYFSGIAPKGTRWVEVSAQAPLLIQVSARVPRTSWPPRPDLIPGDSPQRAPRHWIPMLAAQHPHFDQKGWVMSVKTTPQPRSKGQDESLSEPRVKHWKTLIAKGRPSIQRVLEEDPYQETRFGIQSEHHLYASLGELWKECEHCWLEIPPYQTHRVLDQSDLASSPQALWFTDLQSSHCAFEIDGQKFEFACPVQRERHDLQDLAGGSHHFRWQSDALRDRLWLNRPSVSVHGSDLADGPTLYAERKLSRLGKDGQSYVVSFSDSQSKYLNFRVYRRLKASQTLQGAMREPLAVEIELDLAAPPRHSGRLYAHFTPSRVRRWIMPSATPEIVFLDSDQTGPFQRYEFGFLIGQDIKSGQHRVRIRAKSKQPLWVRAFEQGRATTPSSSSIYGQVKPLK